MREKWKALTKRERLLFAAALVFLALAVLLRFVPGLRFSALLCLCATAVLFVLFVLECAARRGSRAAVWGRRVLLALLAAGFVLFAALETMVIRGSLAEKTDAPVSAVIVLGAGVNGETPSLSLRTRIDAAAAYLARHPDVPVILSGGQGPGRGHHRSGVYAPRAGQPRRGRGAAAAGGTIGQHGGKSTLFPGNA